MKNETLNSLLEMAKSSSCPIELQELHKCEYMNVRRVVAKNQYITSDIANNLAMDPVLNVSYIASKNPKTTIKRDFSLVKISDCVLCEKDERNLDCTECENKKLAV